MDIEKYIFKTEAHAHSSPASKCSEIHPEKLVEIYEGLGYNTVILTNHFEPSLIQSGKTKAVEDYLSDYKKAVEYSKHTKLNIVLGMEIRFTENSNDYLVYGIDEEFIEKSYDYLDGTLEKFYTEMKNDKNVILQAHPFRNNMTLMPEEFLDGIETFNMHPNHNSRVSTACKYIKNHPGMLICGGTDYHHPTQEGCISLNTTHIIKDSFQFADVLKSKDFIFDIIGNKVVPYFG